MKAVRPIALAFVIVAAALCGSIRAGSPAIGAEDAPGIPAFPPPSRIVSLSPSTTEILFAIGAGDRIVGVTRYCRYPAEAASIRRVGGYLDPNYEAIAALEPDLVAILPEQESIRNLLGRLGIRFVIVDNKRIEDIVRSIGTLGVVCGEQERAKRLVCGIEERIEAVRRGVAGRHRPRVLVSVEREVGAGVVRELYAAGRGGIYDELVELAGGENAYRRESPAFPLISAEGIVNLDPDVVIDLVPDVEGRGIDTAAAAADWDGIPGFGKKRRVCVVTADYAFIPGPRFPRFLEDLAGMIHPRDSTETR
ncbi:MAG: ABC transporter substrate-binding protein [Candidatus Krumholzibacteriota bacterium]|nr:ABC transporter substrate-binding protein [Candidatus Krumholzibacteriota bacterium]